VTTVIREREEEAKVVQAQKEEMQATITELEARVKELSGHVGDHREEIDGLAKELKKTQVDL
jgi:peptidoglycan hydrolase CwlO-like protein